MRKPQVLLLKQIIRAVCNVSHSNKLIGYGFSPKKARYFALKDEAMGRSYRAVPTDVPRGHCAVYVGSERSRFVIPTAYLNNSLFRVFLEKAEEEYGFDHQMGLTIPCEEIDFLYLTSMLDKKEVAPTNLKLDELLNMY